MYLTLRLAVKPSQNLAMMPDSYRIKFKLFVWDKRSIIITQPSQPLSALEFILQQKLLVFKTPKIENCWCAQPRVTFLRMLCNPKSWRDVGKCNYSNSGPCQWHSLKHGGRGVNLQRTQCRIQPHPPNVPSIKIHLQ